VKEVALVLRTIAGRDPMDATSAEVPVPDYVAELEKPVKGLKVGVAKEYFGSGLDPEVRAAVEAAIQKLAQLGCEAVPVSLPHTELSLIHICHLLMLRTMYEHSWFLLQGLRQPEPSQASTQRSCASFDSCYSICPVTPHFSSL